MKEFIVKRAREIINDADQDIVGINSKRLKEGRR